MSQLHLKISMCRATVFVFILTTYGSVYAENSPKKEIHSLRFQNKNPSILATDCKDGSCIILEHSGRYYLVALQKIAKNCDLDTSLVNGDGSLQIRLEQLIESDREPFWHHSSDLPISIMKIRKSILGDNDSHEFRNLAIHASSLCDKSPMRTTKVVVIGERMHGLDDVLLFNSRQVNLYSTIISTETKISSLDQYPFLLLSPAVTGQMNGKPVLIRDTTSRKRVVGILFKNQVSKDGFAVSLVIPVSIVKKAFMELIIEM